MRHRTAMILLGIASGILVIPVLLNVYRELRPALGVGPGWLAAIAALVILQFVCDWQLRRMLLRTTAWRDVAVAQLTGNAASHVLPAGSAVGAGIEARELNRRGLPWTHTVTALGATSVTSATAGYLVLPLIVLTASVVGASVDASLASTMWIATTTLAVALVAVITIGRTDRPWTAVARWAARVGRWFGHDIDANELASRLLAERRFVLRALRDRAAAVIVLAVGRPAADYGALLLAAVAVGAHVDPIAVLAAFIVSNIAGLIPFTPGGLGFVEAGLTGVLVAGGASATEALATVALYRVFATWLPALIGLAVGLHSSAWSRSRADPGAEKIMAARRSTDE